MRPFQIDVDPADADPDGLADNNASSGASLTLDGALTSGGTFTSADGLAHRLDIIDTATTDQSGATFTVTGTDADGRAQTEAITGPGSGATVESTKYFLTVSSVTIANGAACGTVDMGTVDEIATKTYPMDHLSPRVPTVHVNLTGTGNYDVQVSARNPFSLNEAAPFAISDQEDFNFLNDGNFGGKTADLLDDLATLGVRAMRFVTNSYTNGVEFQVYVTHPV